MASVERHDWTYGTPVCICQWCCGCPEHPLGEPWGWNHEAWARHLADAHPLNPNITVVAKLRKAAS